MNSTVQKRPKVLQVVHHLDLGGSEEVALALSEQLHDQFDISFFAINGVRDTAVGQDMKRRLDRIGVPVYSGTTLAPKRGGFLVAAFRLALLSRTLRPDVIHLHTEIPELTHALSRGFMHNPAGATPAVTRTIHNTHFWGPWQWLGSQVERRLSDVSSMACSAAALDGMQQFRAGKGLKRLPGATNRVNYNGVAPSRTTRPARRPDGPVRVMFAGRLEPQKGVDLFPDILTQAATLGHPEAELNIYGAGSLGPDLERWASQGMPGWTINLLPPTPHLREHMADHDLLLMPSRFEGLGLVAAEALMSGLPVIGSNVPGLIEVFPEGYPLLTAPEDTAALGTLLAQMLREPAHYLDMAQDWVVPTSEKFGVGRMASVYGDLYRQLLLTRGAARPAAQPRAL